MAEHNRAHDHDTCISLERAYCVVAFETLSIIHQTARSCKLRSLIALNSHLRKIMSDVGLSLLAPLSSITAIGHTHESPATKGTAVNCKYRAGAIKSEDD